jgi:threonine/homoserine/homoserine lactone efflux protein
MVVAPGTLLTFVVAAVPLVLAPGPDTVFVVSRGLRSRRTGVAAALGVAVGVCLHTLAATAGLAALLAAAPEALSLVRTIGAAYLVYLAVDALRGGEFAVSADDDASTPRTGFRGGVLVNALNPKVALFFLAFLPTFAGTGPGSTTRMATLGVVYALLSALYLGVVAAAADRAGRALADARVRRGLDVVAAVAFVAFAVVLLV